MRTEIVQEVPKLQFELNMNQTGELYNTIRKHIFED